MIITTTNNIEGRPVKEYLGLVNGEVINGINFIKDFAAGLTNFFGGRSASYENELIDARTRALEEMKGIATKMGADAIIGVDIDFEVLGADGSMLMVVATGTAVKL